MGTFLWWLLGERRILTTSLPQYRNVGQIVDVAGRCYRITRVVGPDVWGRPLLTQQDCAKVTIVESPLKHLRRSTQESATIS